jgi:hypothetical protein
MYAGCVAGALKKEDYINSIRKAGFTNISVVKEKPRPISDEILSHYLSAKELAEFNKSGQIIFSITVYGEKPELICGGRSCCD